MLHELSEKVLAAESVQAYEHALKELTEYLDDIGMQEDAEKLAEVAVIRKNRFSRREAGENLCEAKTVVAEFCRKLKKAGSNNSTDAIDLVLANFPIFCRNLYMSRMHEKCSQGLKEHLAGFCIENEYDLQKLMLAALVLVFPDARTESVQDSGHHALRKDIVINSLSAVIELKCTRMGMTERQLSEEIAADMVHYSSNNLYFYIYDKVNIIKNPISFKKTYEVKNIDDKRAKIILYTHSDI